MDTELPCITERSELLWLPRCVFNLAVCNVTFPCAHLPVRPKLYPVWRIEVDALHLPLQPLLLGQTRHHQEGVAQDHPVRPVSLVVVEVHPLVELCDSVEVGEKRQLGLRLFLL